MSDRLATKEEILDLAERRVEGMIAETKETLMSERSDIVKVVRCKDCKYHEELLNNNDENVLCWVRDIDVIVDRNGYCNYGERKDGEEE